MTDHILHTRDGALNIIRMNRPDKKNAITRAMYATMTAALQQGEADDSVRCHVIFGVPGAFSAGNDMQDFLTFAMSGSTEMTEVLQFLFALAGVQKPIISGVDGLAIGIGTTLNLHCDLTLATPRTQFRTPFVDLGLVPEAASSLLAPRIMGHGKAFELLVMGRSFNAEQAVASGLANTVVGSDTIEAAAIAAAKELAGKPQEAVKISRRLMKGSPDEILQRIDDEAVLFAERLRSKEAQKAFMAFLSK